MKLLNIPTIQPKVTKYMNIILLVEEFGNNYLGF